MKKNYYKMPEIDLGNIKLRTIKITDYKDMFEYGKNPVVTKYLTWGPFDLESEAKASIKKIFYPRLKEGLPVGYAIIDTKTSKMIGTIDFHSKLKKKNGAEIGFVIHQDYWNQGIMTKCLKKMIEIGFDYLDYDFITIKHLKMNAASQKVIIKAGFQLKNIEHYTYEKKKEVIDDDLLIYELLKEDYHVSKQS